MLLPTFSATSTPTLSGLLYALAISENLADLALACDSFHEEFPQRLVKLQDAHWKPLIEWVEKTYDVKINLYEGILNTRQPDATILKLGSVVSDYDAYKLAGSSFPLMNVRFVLTIRFSQHLSGRSWRPSRT